MVVGDKGFEKITLFSRNILYAEYDNSWLQDIFSVPNLNSIIKYGENKRLFHLKVNSTINHWI